MEKEKIEEGKRLVEAAMKWWGSTLPSFERSQHQDEPIPKLCRWLREHALPELALNSGAKRGKKK